MSTIKGTFATDAHVLRTIMIVEMYSVVLVLIAAAPLNASNKIIPYCGFCYVVSSGTRLHIYVWNVLLRHVG